MRYELKNRVVVITGGSSGIGRACAVEFHRAGSCVVALGRSQPKLDELQAQFPDGRLAVVAADVTDSDQRSRLLEFARRRFGPIDVLVNNAGWASFGSLKVTPSEHVQGMLDLNLVAPIALIQAVLPEMLARRQGQIVNISSVVGYQPMPRMAVYCATKAALNALSTSLRMELRGTGVDVVVVAPGSTRTSFFDSAAQVDTNAIRLAETQQTPERVARAIVRAARQRRREVILSPGGKAITWIRRLTPRLADRIISVVAKRAMPLARDHARPRQAQDSAHHEKGLK